MIDRLIALVCIVVFVAVAFSMIVYLPTALFTEGQCLERGYPKSAVTWNLRRYCGWRRSCTKCN